MKKNINKFLLQINKLTVSNNDPNLRMAKVATSFLVNSNPFTTEYSTDNVEKEAF